MIIGAGNVATHLSLAMQRAGFLIIQIFSQNFHHAHLLANKLNCDYTINITEINNDADYYIFSIKDDAYRSVLKNMPPNKGVFIHTSGSIPLDVFREYTNDYGVIYPLQTLSKYHETNFYKIPLFIEGNTEKVVDTINNIANRLSESVTILTSEKRKYLHLAAVYACNFSNYLYSVASQILEKQGIDWHVLQPLIDETAHKLHDMRPEQAQTGPAVRNDRTIIEMHKSLLEDIKMRQLYTLISENIHNQNINKYNNDQL